MDATDESKYENTYLNEFKLIDAQFKLIIDNDLFDSHRNLNADLVILVNQLYSAISEKIKKIITVSLIPKISRTLLDFSKISSNSTGALLLHELQQKSKATKIILLEDLSKEIAVNIKCILEAHNTQFDEEFIKLNHYPQLQKRIADFAQAFNEEVTSRMISDFDTWLSVISSIVRCDIDDNVNLRTCIISALN
ncbi:MAG: hypothetical protein OHK0017_10570 [Patescibacteria group bacterium]